MTHSTLQCSDPTHHHRQRCRHGKYHSHQAHTHTHNHTKSDRHHRHSLYAAQSSCDENNYHCQCDATTTEFNLTETTTDSESCQYTPQSTTSGAHGFRHVGHSLHVSVNLRFAGTNTVLLPEDVFIPLAGSETLAGIFEAALLRHPGQVGRYILRKEKDVVVLCHNEEKNTYARTTMVFATLSRLRPIRLIYCVVPNVEVIRELDSLKSYTLKVNARTDSDPECILEKDTAIEAQGNVTAGQLWAQLTKTFSQIRGLSSTGVVTRRPDDNVVVRFGMHDFVADLVKSRGRRFIFILTEQCDSHPYTDGNTEKCHRHHFNNDPNCTIRLKPWFRFQPDTHGRRRFQWGLLQKKQSDQKS